MEVIKPPFIKRPKYSDTIFLAGSIEMGKAEDWQKRIEESLKDKEVSIFNPRRDDWDFSWEQKITNPNFFEQVNWELNHLERAKYKVFYFDPATKSPITLMELGHMSNQQNVMVCCPNGYFRKGNVDIFCNRNRFASYVSLEQMIDVLKMRLRNKK